MTVTSIITSFGFTMLLRDEVVIPGARRWVVANAILAIAIVITAVNGLNSPPSLALLIAHVLVVLSAGLQVEAILIFCQRGYPRRLLYAFVLTGAAAVTAAWVATRALAPVEWLVAACCAPLALVVVWSMLVGRGRRLRFSDNFMAFAYLLTFVAFVQAGLTVPAAAADGELLNGVAQTAFYAVMYTAVVCTQAGFVVMTKEESDFQLMMLATLDPLTGIWNRRTFIERAESELRRCARKNAPAAIVLFDLDHFKKVNDTYGHAAGDRVIIDFAATVRSMLREYDLVGRYGGEEFTVLLPETTADSALATADRIREACAAAAVPAGSNHLRYTVSAGVAICGAIDESFDELLLRADAALYAAKAAGRNQVKLSEADDYRRA